MKICSLCVNDMFQLKQLDPNLILDCFQDSPFDRKSNENQNNIVRPLKLCFTSPEVARIFFHKINSNFKFVGGNGIRFRKDLSTEGGSH